MEAIAARATASKATVYRHWPAKAVLVMDAFMARVDPAAPFPDTGSAVEDFVRQLRATATVFGTDPVHSMLVGLITALPGDRELQKAFRTSYMEPRRAQAEVTMRRGQERGELIADLSLDRLFDQLYGAVYLRLILGTPLTAAEAESAVRQAFRGILAEAHR
ncbi:TetR/AcrR family transcriptional regulator [Amycolatopsis ultiminotia]|uniref:TetR/AcrR family transcriptional regulator n=2 Tax=Amycolatopsis ultiminotia TaxID=543629 RepID=A0ABP6WB76_9PSEU